jgi:hypothetical protein
MNSHSKNHWLGKNTQIDKNTDNAVIFIFFIFIIYFAFKLESGDYEAIVVAGDGNKESKDGTATECSFDTPCGIAVDEHTHTCFVAEWGSSRIRKITFVD